MRAFTLLESLVYIALFGLIMAGALSGISAITESAERSETRSLLETEGNFLMEKISFDLLHAQAITLPSKTVATSSELQLVSDLNSTVEISASQGILTRTENSVPVQLSTNTVQVTDVAFSFLPSVPVGSNSDAIQTNLEISARSPSGQQLSESFSTLTYLFP